VSFDEVTHAVEAQRRALARGWIPKSRCARNRNRQAGPGPALPSVRSHRSKPSNTPAFVFKPAKSVVITTTSSVSGATASASSSATSPEKECRRSPDGQSASQSAQPVRHGSQSAAALLCFREPTLLRQHSRRPPLPPSSSPNMTTPRATCVTPIAASPGLVLRRDGTVEHLEATATVLGIFKEWDCEIGECQLRRLTPCPLHRRHHESYNSADEQFGEQRLIEALQRHRHSSSQARASFHR